MRVTSASSSANSLAASAASRALCEPVRSEPGMTRILAVDIKGEMPDVGDQISEGEHPSPSSDLCHPSSDIRSPVHPDPCRRNIHPDPLRSFYRKAAEPFRQRRGDGISELHEGST